MDFTREIKILEEYIKNNYDFENKLIIEKYIHTLNVVKVMLLICEKMEFSDEDIKLAFYLALFHDLVRQNVFNNLKFDHGAYSNKILFNDGFISCFDINMHIMILIRPPAPLNDVSQWRLFF